MEAISAAGVSAVSQRWRDRPLRVVGNLRLDLGGHGGRFIVVRIASICVRRPTSATGR